MNYQVSTSKANFYNMSHILYPKLKPYNLGFVLHTGVFSIDTTLHHTY